MRSISLITTGIVYEYETLVEHHIFYSVPINSSD